MSKQIVMKRPELNHIVMELETPIWTLNHIWADDRSAGKSEYEPTDSTVKSAIRRVMGHLKGRPPKPLVLKKEKEQWIDNVTKNIWQTCQKLEAQSTRKADLLICLSAIEDSIKIRTVGDPRGYLDFLNGFFEELGMTTQEVDEETARRIAEE